MKVRNQRINLKETGITLVALVVTIIVLLILAGVTINLALNNNGAIKRAEEAAKVYENASKNEYEMLETIADTIGGLNTKLSSSEVELINNNIINNQLQKVTYKPKATDTKVTIESKYDGWIGNQDFTQSNLGALNIEWYLLSANENEVKLVSQPTTGTIKLRDASGYDNCLYFFNELSTKLFANEDWGVTANRVKVLSFSDIRDAAKELNAGYKVTEAGEERLWDWDTDVINRITEFSRATDKLGGQGTCTNTSYTHYPKMYNYTTNEDGTTLVVINNSMYDDYYEPSASIPMEDIIYETNAGNPATVMKVNNTAFWGNSCEEWKAKLGQLGNSEVGKELFNTSNPKCWLASRCIGFYDATHSGISMRAIKDGVVTYDHLCTSTGGIDDTQNYAFRVVVSIPASKVNVSSTGEVTLKQ